jgi:hypothetical protein
VEIKHHMKIHVGSPCYVWEELKQLQQLCQTVELCYSTDIIKSHRGFVAPPKVLCWSPTRGVMVLGSGAFQTWLGHNGGVQNSSTHSTTWSQGEKGPLRSQEMNHEVALTRHWVFSCLGLRLLPSSTVIFAVYKPPRIRYLVIASQTG